MSDILSSFVGQVLSKIDYSEVWFHEILSDISNPTWNSCRKQSYLDFTFAYFMNLLHDFVNVIFETKFEHHISLIKNHCFQSLEVDVSPLNVIKYSASGTNK